MSQLPPPISSDLPPTNSDFSIPPEVPAWPKVVGIISIVWGAIGTVCNLCGVFGGMMGDAFIKMAPPEQQAQLKAQAQQAGPAQYALYAFGTMCALLLIVAGVMLLQRKMIGRLMHLIYGALGVLLTIASVPITLSAMNDQLARMSSDPNAQAGMAAVKPAMYGGLAFGVCLGIAYPAFCLIWFGMIKRTHASMTGGVVDEPLV